MDLYWSWTKLLLDTLFVVLFSNVSLLRFSHSVFDNKLSDPSNKKRNKTKISKKKIQFGKTILCAEKLMTIFWIAVAAEASKKEGRQFGWLKTGIRYRLSQSHSGRTLPEISNAPWECKSILLQMKKSEKKEFKNYWTKCSNWTLIFCRVWATQRRKKIWSEMVRTRWRRPSKRQNG